MFPSTLNSKGSTAIRVILLGVGIALATLAIAGAISYSKASILRGTGQSATAAAQPRGVAIVNHGGYPELQIDGVPFFIHSAAFHYYRVPRDQWAKMLSRYKALGINTIDIYIPWNWHEPREGQLDFDGHSNPRRDLRGLLQLITEKGFKLNARPGPQILNEWRHGGYPEWLLERPEYHMDAGGYSGRALSAIFLFEFA